MGFKYICEMDKYNSTIGMQNVDYHGALFSWTEQPLALRTWTEYQTQGITSNHCTVAGQGHGWSWSIWYNWFTWTQPQSPRIPTLYLPTSNTPSISWQRWSQANVNDPVTASPPTITFVAMSTNFFDDVNRRSQSALPTVLVMAEYLKRYQLLTVRDHWA